MLQITDWHNRYEVGSRGGKPKDGEPLRVGPLEFIRLNAHGRSQGPGYRRLLGIAGKRTMQVFGIFCKFLEIAGNECKDKRGMLYNESGKPATAEDLAFILSVPIEQIKHAVMVLCDKKVSWLINTTQLNTTQHNSTLTQGAGNSGKFREIPGNSGKAKKEPEEKHAYGEFVRLTKLEYEKLQKQFGSQLQDKIDALNEGIGSKGYKYKSHYFTILSWERRNANGRRKTTTNSQREGAPAAGGRRDQTPRRDTSGSSEIGTTIEA